MHTHPVLYTVVQDMELPVFYTILQDMENTDKLKILFLFMLKD